jgi:plastocyanin
VPSNGVEKGESEPTDQHKEDVMKKLKIIIVMAIAMVATVSRGVANADGGKKVDVKGLETFEANSLFLSNLRFTPENIKVDKGDKVTWSDVALTPVPHTITIVEAADLPSNFAEAYICNWDKRILGFDGPCLQFVDAHGGIPPTTPVVEVGRKGLDAPGDSIFLPQTSSVSAQITAAPGSVLHYICIIHPWMQGSITVEEDWRRKQKTISSSEPAKRPFTATRETRPLHRLTYLVCRAVDSEVHGRIGSRTDPTASRFSASSRLAKWQFS